jgi:hypothetical protein
MSCQGANPPQCHFFHHKFTWADLGSNTGRRGGKPATDRIFAPCGSCWNAETSKHERNNRSTSVYCSLLGNARNNECAAQRRDRCYALTGKHVSTIEAEFCVRIWRGGCITRLWEYSQPVWVRAPHSSVRSQLSKRVLCQFSAWVIIIIYCNWVCTRWQ